MATSRPVAVTAPVEVTAVAASLTAAPWITTSCPAVTLVMLTVPPATRRASLSKVCAGMLFAVAMPVKAMEPVDTT